MPFISRVRVLCTNWEGGWLGPRAGLDAVAKKEKSSHCPYRELNRHRPAHGGLVTKLTKLSRLLLQFCSAEYVVKIVMKSVSNYGEDRCVNSFLTHCTCERKVRHIITEMKIGK
jgi:hypothetical protein